MTTVDFARYVADKYGMTYKDSSLWTRCIFESIGDVLISGEDLMVTGLGTFRTHISKQKRGRNQYTGESIIIPERPRVKFIVSDTIKKLMWEQFELDSGISQDTAVFEPDDEDEFNEDE